MTCRFYILVFLCLGGLLVVAVKSERVCGPKLVKTMYNVCPNGFYGPQTKRNNVFGNGFITADVQRLYWIEF